MAAAPCNLFLFGVVFKHTYLHAFVSYHVDEDYPSGPEIQ